MIRKYLLAGIFTLLPLVVTLWILNGIFNGLVGIFRGPLTWVVQGNDFFLYRAFAPKYEQVRRETFEQSKAYRQGMVQELQNMQFQYEQADPAHRQALASIILHRVADVDGCCPGIIPPDLRAFIDKLKAERIQTQSRPSWEK